MEKMQARPPSGVRRAYTPCPRSHPSGYEHPEARAMIMYCTSRTQLALNLRGLPASGAPFPGEEDVSALASCTA